MCERRHIYRKVDHDVVGQLLLAFYPDKYFYRNNNEKARGAIIQVCLVFLRPGQQLGYIADGSLDSRLTILLAAVLPHTRQSGETFTSVSAGQNYYTDPTIREQAATAGIDSGPPQRSRALYRLSYRAP